MRNRTNLVLGARMNVNTQLSAIQKKQPAMWFKKNLTKFKELKKNTNVSTE